MRAYVLEVMFLLHILHTEGQPEPLVEDPVRVPAKVLRESAADTCPSEQDTIDAKDELRQNIFLPSWLIYQPTAVEELVGGELAIWT